MLVVGGLGYLGYDWWKKKQDEKDSAKAKADEEAIAKASSTTTTATPKPARVVETANSVFPLRKGSKNEKVKVLQYNLGLPETTVGFGYFGNKTAELLKYYYGKDTIANESEFKIVMQKLSLGDNFKRQIDFLNKNGFTFSDISTFNPAFVKEWANRARMGKYTFTVKGKTYRTYGGSFINTLKEGGELIKQGVEEPNIFKSDDATILKKYNKLIQDGKVKYLFDKKRGL